MTKKEIDEYLFRLFSADPSINATNIAEDLSKISKKTPAS